MNIATIDIYQLPRSMAGSRRQKKYNSIRYFFYCSHPAS